jgi:hypothetical protein
VISGQDEDVLRILPYENVEILKNGVRRPPVPVLPDALLGGHNIDVLSHFAVEEVPSFLDVGRQGMRFVLGQNVDSADPGVDAVRQCEIDDAVDAAEGDGWLCAVAGEGVEAFALAYRETIALSEAEGMLLPWLMITLRLIDALWMAEDLPIDYRHELEMTQQLVEWLLDDAETLQNVFCA